MTDFSVLDATNSLSMCGYSAAYSVPIDGADHHQLRIMLCSPLGSVERLHWVFLDPMW